MDVGRASLELAQARHSRLRSIQSLIAPRSSQIILLSTESIQLSRLEWIGLAVLATSLLYLAGIHHWVVEMVVKHVFSFDVPPEKVPAYMEFSAKVAKPFFENWPGINSYDVFQTVVGRPVFTKEIVYKDMDAFSRAQAKLGEPEAQKVAGQFFSFVKNLESRLILEVV